MVAKAEHTGDKSNPRFIVTSLSKRRWAARALYEDFYCARGEAENRIKECQLDLFADRLSTETLRGNQLRLVVGVGGLCADAGRRSDWPVPRSRVRATTIRLRLEDRRVVTVSARRVKPGDE